MSNTPLKKIYLEITDSCNLECKICYRHHWAEKPADMQQSLWEKAVSEIQAMPGITTVVLGGMGEPLVSPWFEKTVEAFTDKQIWVTSNATLFKEKLTTEIVRHIDLFIVSVDGMEQQMVQGRGVVFDDLMANLDYLNRLKEKNGQETPHLDIQFVASRKNIDDIFPLMDVLADKKIRNLVISHLMPQEVGQSDDILYQLHGNDQVKQLFHRIRNYSFRRGLRVVFPEVELKTERRCAFVNNDATYITSRGEVVPCYRLSHEGSEVVFGRPKTIRQYSFGNITRRPLAEIWNDENYSKFRQRIYNNHYPSCPDCDLVEGCSLIHDVDFDCHGEEPNCADCLWSRKFVFCN
ncbi:MAG: SPASM domain-containing protein [Bacteroidota bacterium]